MHGLNGEAGVLLEGPAASAQMQAVAAHVDECAAQAVEYSRSMKEAYAWWAVQYFEGLAAKANDVPRDGEGEATIIVLAVKGTAGLPAAGDVIYFELPAALGQIQSLRAEVHLYVFDPRPLSAAQALTNLDRAESFWCQTLGLEKERGGVELRADWHIVSSTDPRLERTPRPFRPTPTPDMQQVRVKVANKVFGRFEYLFQAAAAKWRPLLPDAAGGAERAQADRSALIGERTIIRVPESELQGMAHLDLIPREDLDWFLVLGLESADAERHPAYRKALVEASPEGGGFILFARRRRELDRKP
jgi:hypothetical protein